MGKYLALLRKTDASTAPVDCAEHKEAEMDPYDRAKALAREAERGGCDLVDRIQAYAPELLATQAPGGGWTPAHSILATCQHYGIALRIDPQTGDLVVGRAGAKADEPSQPWSSLLLALEAHLEAVAALVVAAWTLQASFPKVTAA